MENILKDRPKTLENKLIKNKENLAWAGFDTQELNENVSGYVSKKPLRFKINGKLTEGSPNEKIYFYFDKKENSIEIPIGSHTGMYLPLDKNKYGYSQNVVEITPKRVENLVLNEYSEEVYSNLLKKTRIAVPELLENVGKIINQSMEYDFSKIKDLGKKLGNESDWSEAEKIYKPQGDEVSKGICTDAGTQIREILRNIGLGKEYGIFHVTSSKNNFNHDTTLVINKKSGEWGVINSKSPTKDFNYSTLEQLEKLGSPYFVN